MTCITCQSRQDNLNTSSCPSFLSGLSVIWEEVKTQSPSLLGCNRTPEGRLAGVSCCLPWPLCSHHLTESPFHFLDVNLRVCRSFLSFPHSPVSNPLQQEPDAADNLWSSPLCATHPLLEITPPRSVPTNSFLLVKHSKYLSKCRINHGENNTLRDLRQE